MAAPTPAPIAGNQFFTEIVNEPSQLPQLNVVDLAVANATMSSITTSNITNDGNIRIEAIGGTLQLSADDNSAGAQIYLSPNLGTGFPYIAIGAFDAVTTEILVGASQDNLGFYGSTPLAQQPVSLAAVGGAGTPGAILLTALDALGLVQQVL